MAGRGKGSGSACLVRRTPVTEGTPFSADRTTAALIANAALRLQGQLQPRLPFLSEVNGQLVLRNVIGVIRLDDGSFVEVSPKVDAEEDWVRATLDLLIGTDRVDVAGERLAGITPYRRDLLEVLAATYAARLRRALRRDGPMATLERRTDSIARLKGKLLLSRWMHSVALKPQLFPVSFDTIDSDNAFTRAMALVARLLASASAVPATRSALQELSVAVRPGAAEEAPIDPSVINRPFPQQWAVYRPVWSIVVAILSRTSLLGSRGQHIGLEVAVEAWPLLERLLDRSMSAAVELAGRQGRRLVKSSRSLAPLLTNPPPNFRRRFVEADGWLIENGQTVATFEAKYSPGPLPERWPERAHLYQAVSTAAACQSPLAVLVYPGHFEPLWWDTSGFDDKPSALVAVGLGLFSYRRGDGDRVRGETLLNVLGGRPALAVSVRTHAI